MDKNEEQSRHGECVAPDVSVLLVTYELKRNSQWLPLRSQATLPGDLVATKTSGWRIDSKKSM
ncbi:hypothetical protein H9L39_12437 [Fusarium oxysporum f. sp. albedinis]|nr:hypothetical protein H9L39_12437 [Fusarium oxysporum f. sp. albedinis]